MKLSDAIAAAANKAYEYDHNTVVGQINKDNWQIAHAEDMGRIANMIEPIFTCDSSGVLQEHVDNGEITENWELPK